MKKILLVISLFTIPLLSYSQAGDEVFSIGACGGPNITWVKFTGDEVPKGAISDGTGKGYDYNLFARIKFKEGLFACTGLSYQMQGYNIYFYNGGIAPPVGEENLNNSYLSIPLMAGYSIIKKKWNLFIGLGIEFYYNYQNKLTVYDLLHGRNEIQKTFFNGQQNFNSGFIDDMGGRWSFMGAFGLLNAGISYSISSRFSIACMPLFRFTNPFAQDLSAELPETYVRGLGSFSLNFGLNYDFIVHDGGGSFQGEGGSGKDIALGFDLIPNYMTNKIINSPFVFPGQNAHFTFSYEFTVGFGLSEWVKLETGIAIDNFNYLNINNVFLGLPVIVKYYLPLGEAHPFYVAGGCHVDYPTNIGWEYIAAHPFILPIALFKCGYHLKFGENYFFDIALGYEHQFPYIQASNEANRLANAGYSISGLPDFLFSTVGVGYKF